MKERQRRVGGARRERYINNTRQKQRSQKYTPCACVRPCVCEH